MLNYRVRLAGFIRTCPPRPAGDVRRLAGVGIQTSMRGSPLLTMGSRRPGEAVCSLAGWTSSSSSKRRSGSPLPG